MDVAGNSTPQVDTGPDLTASGAIPVRVPSLAAIAAHWEAVERMLAEAEEYGQIKPIISASMAGHTFVAVGNDVYCSNAWRTFPDFLLGYIKIVLGQEWWQMELQKPGSERHQLLQWNHHVCDYQKLQQRGPEGLYAMVPDGVTAAYLLLAYDLYVLRHHKKLQDFVVHRLKKCEFFSAARYELFVTATLIRAGFAVEHEDETDPSAKHPEFVATHNATGESIDVEAKSCNRSGVLGCPGERTEPQELKLNLHRKLNDAYEKARNRPLVVFVDLNLPADRVTPASERLINEVRTAIANFESKVGSVCLLSLLVVTNYTDHYAGFGQSDLLRFNYIAEPHGTLKNPIMGREIITDIERALRQYGSIPNALPGYDPGRPEITGI